MIPAPSLALDTWLDTGLKDEEAPSVPSGSSVALHVFYKIGYYKQVADLRRPRQHQPQSRVIYKWELKRTPLLLPTVLLSASLPHLPLRLPNVHRHSSNKHSHPSLETVSRSCRTLHYQAWPLGGTPTRCWASRQRGGSAARKAAGNCPSQSIALEGRGQRELFSF